MLQNPIQYCPLVEGGLWISFFYMSRMSWCRLPLITVTFHMFQANLVSSIHFQRPIFCQMLLLCPIIKQWVMFFFFHNLFLPALGKDSGLHIREDMRGQLKEASSVTSKAFSAFRKELDPDLEGLGQTSEIVGAEDALEETQMSPAITIMKPILRYLQLLCENHNSELQVLAPFSLLRVRTLKSSCC